MAQTIYCAAEDGTAATHLVTDIEAGETAAWCFPHFVLMCRALVEQVDRVEADETAAQAEHALRGVSPAAEEAASGLTVVRRGTSRSRKAYEARRRTKATEVDEDNEDESDEPPRPSEEPTEDPDAGSTVTVSASA